MDNAIPYQLCPKCWGDGIVPSYGTATTKQCDVCNGNKIIPMYFDKTNPNEQTPIDLTDAINLLSKELNKDKSEGSYYYGWQSNIAMAFVDAYLEYFNAKTLDPIYKLIANNAAKMFLNLLIYNPQNITKKHTTI